MAFASFNRFSDHSSFSNLKIKNLPTQMDRQKPGQRGEKVSFHGTTLLHGNCRKQAAASGRIKMSGF
jgi:hypothetical protein